ncbi:MAG: hypothetical protein WAK93_17995 [Solirubrobacteraceae bacterium]
MTSSWKEWTGATSVTVLTVALVILDLVDSGFRRWLTEHPFTTTVVGGVLVLLLTVLIVDRVVDRRRLRDRSQAIAAQAAIVTSQAVRTVRSVSSMLTGDGDRDAASDELRTYMTMLLIAAPVLIDARTSRAFLEEAQRLGGEMAHAFAATAKSTESPKALSDRLNQAVDRARAAATPLMQILDVEQRTAVASETGSAPTETQPTES